MMIILWAKSRNGGCNSGLKIAPWGVTLGQRGAVMTEKHRFSAGYDPLRGFVARIRPALWRLFVGIGVIALVYVIGVTLFFLAFAGAFGDGMAHTPREMILFLISFSVMILAVVLATLWPAGRPIVSLIGPLPAAWRDFWQVLRALSPFLVLMFLGTILFEDQISAYQPVMQILPWLPLAILALLIQTSAEELVFRGYIMGQLAARFSHPMIWLVLPAILFGALHYDGESYGADAWIICVATALFALIAGDLTARTGNLGAAIALHFVNNFFAMVLIGETGRMDGLSLYTMPLDLTDGAMLAAQFVLTIILWLAARLALRV